MGNDALYYIRQGNDPGQGPFDIERIRRYVDEGRVRRDMWFSTDGEHWIRGRDLPELFGPEHAGGTPPPIPQVAPVATPVPPPPPPALSTPTRRSRRAASRSSGPGPWVVIGPLAGLLLLLLVVWGVKSVPVGREAEQAPAGTTGGTGAGTASGGPTMEPTPTFGEQLTTIRRGFRKATERSIAALDRDIAEAEAQGMDARPLQDARAALDRMLREVDPLDPNTWVVPELELPDGTQDADRAWGDARKAARESQLEGLRAARIENEPGVIAAWRAWTQRARRCGSIAAKLHAQARSDGKTPSRPTAVDPARLLPFEKLAARATMLEQQLAQLETRARGAALEPRVRADVVDLLSDADAFVEQARQTLGLGRQLLQRHQDDARGLVPRYLEEAEHLLGRASDAAEEVVQLLVAPPTPEADELADPNDAAESAAEAAAPSPWPTPDTWGDLAESDLADVDRPVFGIQITNKTAKRKYRRQKYIWTDEFGRRWTNYRRVPDGDLVTLYVRVTAVDVPAEVMGITGELLFSAGGAKGLMTFPVKSVPMKEGEDQVERVDVHVPQATIDREGGNWLRKVKSEALAQHLYVRLNQVRFMDGRSIRYRAEPSVAPGDVPVGPALPYPIHEPESGLTAEQIAGDPDALNVVPYKGGKVWVPRQRTKRGMWIQGHWRRRPPPEAIPKPPAPGAKAKAK